MATPVIEIAFDRPSKTYHPGQIVSGVVAVQAKSEIKHDGLFFMFEGAVNIHLSPKAAGILQSLSNEATTIPLASVNQELIPAGRFPMGVTKLPFQFRLEPKSNKVLYESYHGVYISIQYVVKVQGKKALMMKQIEKISEFIVEYDRSSGTVAKPQPFTCLMTSDSVTSGPRVNFTISCHANSISCCLQNPFTGEVFIEKCSAAIKSMELQLVRVETCGSENSSCRDVTEVQNIQIADGDLPTGIKVPIYMVFPRLFSCATLTTANFKLEFEVNLIVIFQDDNMIMKNIPIVLHRF